MSRRVATLLVVATLLATSAAPVAGGSPAAEAYSGAHISFSVQSHAVTDYTVEGATLFDSLKVQSQSSAESAGLVSADASLKAVTTLSGSALSLTAKTQASARISAEGSASISAHDNGHGILVVSAGSEPQYVVANLSQEASASQAGESMVRVTAAGDTQGTFIVVGDGSVTVNENGDVSAKLGANGTLVFRAYPSGRNDDDQNQERLIARGQVAGEAYVMRQDGQTVTDTVNYTQQTAITIRQRSENAVAVTVDRAEQTGKIVIASVTEAAVGSLENVTVRVDGEAAAQVSSYSALTAAIGGDQSKYMVRQSAGTKARADVLVAFSHFSTRTASISGSGGNGTTTTTTATAGDATTAGGDGGSGGGSSGGSTPGFGVAAALVAVAAVALYGRHR